MHLHCLGQLLCMHPDKSKEVLIFLLLKDQASENPSSLLHNLLTNHERVTSLEAASSTCYTSLHIPSNNSFLHCPLHSLVPYQDHDWPLILCLWTCSCSGADATTVKSMHDSYVCP
jgi:hypothetical protein